MAVIHVPWLIPSNRVRERNQKAPWALFLKCLKPRYFAKVHALGHQCCEYHAFFLAMVPACKWEMEYEGKLTTKNQWMEPLVGLKGLLFVKKLWNYSIFYTICEIAPFFTSMIAMEERWMYFLVNTLQTLFQNGMKKVQLLKYPISLSCIWHYTTLALYNAIIMAL